MTAVHGPGDIRRSRLRSRRCSSSAPPLVCVTGGRAFRLVRFIAPGRSTYFVQSLRSEKCRSPASGTPITRIGVIGLRPPRALPSSPTTKLIFSSGTQARGSTRAAREARDTDRGRSPRACPAGYPGETVRPRRPATAGQHAGEPHRAGWRSAPARLAATCLRTGQRRPGRGYLSRACPFWPQLRPEQPAWLTLARRCVAFG
ncbi:hypothetical protein ShzoTeo12_53530 (plasmid) [Shinella zoogloeoides]|nr:hypothetical protein ShzoTeo12_53530 [Shinella zoogloeoides]